MEGTCYGMPVKVIDGFWEWRLSMNPGSAFGLFGALGADITRWLLSAVGFAALGGMVWMLRKSRADQKILHWALAFVAGGAVGNLIDRIWFGQVTDFVLWRYKTHQWPVFNVADVVLVIGVGLMFIDIEREGKREKARKAEAKAKAKQAGLVKHD
jgi:signal peptidase II